MIVHDICSPSMVCYFIYDGHVGLLHLRSETIAVPGRMWPKFPDVCLAVEENTESPKRIEWRMLSFQ